MDDRIGQQLGNYRLIGLLGKGGFADTYLGEHIYLKTFASVKVLQTQLQQQSDQVKFRDEAHTIAHLKHPNIVHVLDFGVDGETNTPYLVMDYASNGTLRQRHRRGVPLPIVTIVPYVRNVASALQYAHERQVVHRDVKPENMLLGANDEVLLSDFGIAVISQHTQSQKAQDIAGTVTYMAPEQIQGRARPASDQYALGVVVYEWLCGVVPFNGTYIEVALQHERATPVPLRQRVASIPPDVEQVVLNALQKDPQRRFGSIQAFANALEQASKGAGAAPISLHPVPNTVSPMLSQPLFTSPTMPAPPPNTEHNDTNWRSDPPVSPTIFDYERRQAPTPFVYDYESTKKTQIKEIPLPPISQPPLQQYKDYVKFRIHHYSKKALKLLWIHNISQVIILVGAALISITVSFPHIPTWIPTLISGIVIITTAITNYYKFGDRSRDLYRSAEDMQQEYNWFKSKRGPYKNLDEQQSFEMLQDRIDTLKREQFIRSFAFEEQKENQK